MKNKNKAGFTLVELAIVLVIIGLIVGGVLVGQDLIKAASIRATVTDIEKFNAAATTFRGKYQGYPGDLASTRATEFGFLTGAGRTGGPGLGDGNGLMEGGSAALTTNLAAENALFWVDLASAGLIPANTKTYAAGTIGVPAQTNPVLAGAGYIPKTKLRDSALVTVFSTTGRNYFGISGWSTTGTAGALTLGSANGLSPLEARGIDEKLDDGVPWSGIVQEITAIATGGTTPALSSTVDACTVATGYNSTSDTVLNTVACSVQIRTNF